MRVIVTGGGTGGHIYPAIAIADKIREMQPDSQVLYIGNELGLEKEIVPRAGYDFEMVTARWLERGSAVELLKTGWDVMRGTAQARKLMKKFRPDVVIGTGGFVCVPVMLAGRQVGARTYLHEQNAYPGVANRFLERYVKHVFLGFPDAARYFKEPKKLVEAGNPVRRSFFQLTKEDARRQLGFSQDAFIVLSFGGSQGAGKINDVAFDLMETVNGQEKVMLIFGTGTMYYEEILEKAEKKGIRVQDNILIKDYLDPMDEYLAACDVVISRSGALSVAETTVCGKAAVLIPSPNVTGNHQYYNAKAVADKGGAILIEEKDLTSEKLIEEVLTLRNHPEKLAAMSRASRACAPDRALDIIYETIQSELR